MSATATRTALVERSTQESDVRVELDLDGTGQGSSDTGVPFFDHMVAQLGKHGGFDLTVRTRGDLEVDAHHTVEDTSLAIGTALKQALGDKAGIRGSATPWCRSTSASCRRPSTCPAARTSCTTSRSWSS
jgi:imidazoleglycerol phosphate dehydratase HisB